MGRQGCEVHAFDPTVDLPQQLAPNVTFHKLGFKYAHIGDIKQSVDYASIDAPLYSLNEVIQMLGHGGRQLDILKMDCEGCEWGLISDLKQPTLLGSGPNSLLLEVHLSAEFGIHSAADIHTVAGLYDYLFQSKTSPPFERFFWHENPGWETHNTIIEPLLAAGMHNNSCCRELGFIRKAKLQRPARVRSTVDVAA